MYVIYLSSQTFQDSHEAYGYWTGKNYSAQGELFPVCERKISGDTKRYKSKKQAERGLECCMNRGYAYVAKGWIEEESK